MFCLLQNRVFATQKWLEERLRFHSIIYLINDRAYKNAFDWLVPKIKSLNPLSCQRLD